MGVVYQAADVQTERPVSLKVLSERVTSDEKLVKGILQRARWAVRLDHPHLVAILDATESEGYYYIVREYVEGQGIDDLIARDGRVSLRLSYDIIGQVADVLDYLHQQGIIHRNLKPSKILLGPEGQAKLLLDPEVMFLKGAEEKIALAGIEGPRGTVTYMSPEQISPDQIGVKSIDARSDIYSLGILLYEMLAGEPPFIAPGYFAIQIQHVSSPPPPLTEACPDLPAEVEEVVLKALAKHPDERYQSAGELARALQLALPEALLVEEKVLQKRASLLEQVATLRSALTELRYVDVRKELSTLTGLEGKLGIKGPELEGALAVVEEGIDALQGSLSRLSTLDRKLAELMARVSEMREAYQTLQSQMDAAVGIDFSAETPVIKQALKKLGEVTPESRFRSTRKLNGLLRRVEEPAQMQSRIAEKVEAREKAAQRLAIETDLTLHKRPTRGEFTDYGVILSTARGEMQSYITVHEQDRAEVMSRIDQLTLGVSARRASRGMERAVEAKVPEMRVTRSLAHLGDIMYGLFLPSRIQHYLKSAETSLLIKTNDLVLPWELMYDGEDFLCLQNPVGRLFMGREFPRQNPYERGEKLRFLLIANPTGDLEAAEREVEHISTGLEGAGVEIDVWIREEVNGWRLQEVLRAGRYDVIHYAGHAYFDSEEPDKSALLLADEYKLIAQKIQRLLRGRPLIFLNACESGRAAIERGEISYTGAYTEGLASSFIMGGALGFIGALWPIYDIDAAEFATIFYQRLLAGEMIGEALRQARLKLREMVPDDITWASFILYGDPKLRIIE